MADHPNETKVDPSVSGDGRLAWVHPAIETFPARDADIIANPYGGSDAGIYHS